MRSRRVATLVTMNMTTNGKTPSSAGPIRSKMSTGQVGVDPGEQAEQHARHHDHQGDGAVVAAQLAQDAARGGEGDPASVHAAAPCRPAVGRVRGVDQREEGLLGVVGAGALEQLGQRGVAEDAARRAAAAAGRSATASSMTWLETNTVRPSRGEPAEQVPQVAPQHRVEPDGRLVEHEHLGVADERAGEAGPRPLPAREVLDLDVGVVGEVDRRDGAVDGIAPRRP